MGGMRDQKEWGPHVWHYLHTLAATYQPSLQREAVKSLLDNLPILLPCSVCRKHLAETYTKPPFDADSRERALRSRDALVVWVNRLHNTVSERTGGDKFPLFEANVPSKCMKNQWALVVLLIALLVVALIMCPSKCRATA
jgi:hypothetical protein